MRLIDADALKEDYRMADDCKDCKTNVRDCEYDRVYTKMDFCGWLDDAPTVDAVEVVRCRDCRHRHKDGFGSGYVCTYHVCSFGVKDDDFCSKGERKDSDGNG